MKVRMILPMLALLCFTALGCLALAQNGPGPNDTTKTHDYARHVGSAHAKKLSTGWSSGHGSRTHQTHDYYRHSHNGGSTHVHGYYHSSHRH